jgi:hypothetical protein
VGLRNTPHSTHESPASPPQRRRILAAQRRPEQLAANTRLRTGGRIGRARDRERSGRALRFRWAMLRAGSSPCKPTTCRHQVSADRPACRRTVVKAMDSDPVSWTSLDRHRAAGRHGTFQPLARGEAAMSEFAMVTYANAQVLSRQPHRTEDGEQRPDQWKRKRAATAPR